MERVTPSVEVRDRIRQEYACVRSLVPWQPPCPGIVCMHEMGRLRRRDFTFSPPLFYFFFPRFFLHSFIFYTYDSAKVRVLHRAGGVFTYVRATGRTPGGVSENEMERLKTLTKLRNIRAELFFFSYPDGMESESRAR